MRLDRLGMSARTVVTADGTTAWVPYGVAAQGVLVWGPGVGVQVAVLPVAAAEDPRFGPLLCGVGIYRLEDPSGRMARIGQGRILDRVRRHRAAPVVLPSRLLAATATMRRWTAEEREYLETRWANHSRDAGDVLASEIFVHRFPAINAWRSAELERQFKSVLKLLGAGSRLVEGDPDNEFADASDGVLAEMVAPVGKVIGYSRSFDVGTLLSFEDGWLRARASVERDAVWLAAGSIVGRRVAPGVGRIFARDHQRFLERGAAVPIDDSRARITCEVDEPTPAGLIKRVTAGRLHNADRWTPLFGDEPRFRS